MPTAEEMTETVNAYLAAINAGDMPAVMALYSDDAAVEDPAGTEPKRGAQILEFYTSAFSGGAKVALTGPVPAQRQGGRLSVPRRNHPGRQIRARR